MTAGARNACSPPAARAAEADAQRTDEERDIGNEAFWRGIAANFAAAKTMLLEKAEQLGIEIEPISAAEFAEYRKREKDFIRSQPLAKLAERYWKETRRTLEAKDDWLIFSPDGEETQTAMLEIIYWYQFFISAKIQRGFHGLNDLDGGFTEEKLTDAQSDANGSVKAALIAADRSIMAWTVLMSEENSPMIAPHISLLRTIRQTAERKFPNARDFVRPGFDEIVIVM